MTYIFKYKKDGALFAKKIAISGHNYEENQDKMVLYLPNGGLKEIANWKCHAVELGTDWMLTVKKIMEDETNQKIQLNINKNKQGT